MIRVDIDEVMEWYRHIQHMQELRIPPSKFCKKFKLCIKKMRYFLNRLVYKSIIDSEWYSKYVPIGRKYLESGLSPSKFAQDYQISVKTLSQLVTHLRYLDLIAERVRKDVKPEIQYSIAPEASHSEQPEITFHKVPILPPVVPQEVYRIATAPKKRNDIELSGPPGVRVLISPEVGTEKLIKIIQLLQEI